MMYYENGRFRIGAVSFILPSPVFISPEMEMEIEIGFELLDPTGRVRVTIQGELSDDDSLTVLTEGLPADTSIGLMRSKPFPLMVCQDIRWRIIAEGKTMLKPDLTYHL